MSISRVVPNLTVADLPAAVRLYTEVLGMVVVMDHGWVATVADPDDPSHQLNLLTADATGPVNPDVSLQVDDVDAAYAQARTAGLEIVHELNDEEWGVRRFFFRDPDGNVVNVVAHR